ncbi:MAG: DNA polymerase IV [Candidatus Edwardsbacteria bacterium]|jgi:nucleotidyltransferase/DNA polymerase involved in DNA repair|nr:DNA polymerase IV [Candidatus Edwardsbacteria bacterium]
MTDASGERVIAHVDMDAFFTAVEVMDDPSLRGRPVIVGADPRNGAGRGVVSAASYEARRFGVHSAMPISQAYRLCPGAAFLPGRMRRYGEVSGQVMAVLEGFTPLVEQVSVDEAFLDLSGCRRLWGDAHQTGARIKAAVRQRTGLTASVGIGPNKLVAKIASDLRKPDGLVVVAAGDARAFLAPLPIRRLWGVGPATEAALLQLGVGEIGQLAALDPAALAARFGESGRWLQRCAAGEDDDPVSGGRGEKSLGAELTFDRDTADREQIVRTLLELCDRVAARLRRQGLRGRTITLKLRYQGFETHTHRATVAEGLDETIGLYTAARGLLQAHGDRTRPLRLVGVTVTNFGGSGRPPDLFAADDPLRGRRRTVDAAVDTVRERFGRRAVVRARTLRRDAS